MVTATLLLILQATPDATPGLLAGASPRSIRLVQTPAQTDASPSYETWTRSQLRNEYDRLEGLRPGIFLEVSLISVGLAGAGISAAALVVVLNSFFGVDAALAIGLALGIVTGIGMAIIGVILLVRLSAERNAIGRQMDEIDEVYRSGPRWSPQPRPCTDLPPSQVLAPTSRLITVAVF